MRFTGVATVAKRRNHRSAGDSHTHPPYGSGAGSGSAPGSSPGWGVSIGDGSPLGTTSGWGSGSWGVVVMTGSYPGPSRNTDPVTVHLVHLDAPALLALAEGDLERAQQTAPVPLSPWLVSPEAIGTWRFRARQAVESPQDLPWVTGVLWDDEAQVVVGKAGFHAAPDPDGLVEVGYAVEPAYRRRGYARAALEQMIARARAHPDVRVLRASVSPDNGPSLALVAQYPFVRTGEQWDEEDGLETIYEIDVSSAGNA